LGGSVGGQQKAAHLLELHRGGLQSSAVAGGKGGGVCRGSGGPRPVNLSGQLSESVGHCVVTEADRSVQRDHLCGGLVLRCGNLSGLAGERSGLAYTAFGSDHPSRGQQHFWIQDGVRWIPCGRHLLQGLACQGGLTGHPKHAWEVREHRGGPIAICREDLTEPAGRGLNLSAGLGHYPAHGARDQLTDSGGVLAALAVSLRGLLGLIDQAGEE
jgi:hypothetical protein